MDNVITHFHVSNEWSYPPPLWKPNQNQIRLPYSYQWGWYPGGNFIPFSMMNYISVPVSSSNSPSNTAIIMVPGGGQDSLVVRLNNYNYPPYSNYNIIFEKVVPIFIGP